MKNEATTTTKVVHSPLMRFRKRAHCHNCELKDACRADRLQELRCILSLIADSMFTSAQLNTIRGAHL